MGYHSRPFAEFQELRQNLLNSGCVHDHAVIDAGQLFNSKWNGHLGVDKGGKTVCDLAIFHQNRADLNDLAGQRGKSGGLNIKDNKSAVQRLALGIGYHTFQIIYKVRLHTIKHLEFGVLRHTAAPGIKAVVCLRECLYHTVVCDGNGRMSPLIGTLYQSFRLCDAVHVAHLGVAVKLHSLLRTGVHSGASEICNLLDSGNGTNGKLAVETVDGGDALDFQEGAFFHMLCYFRHLLVAQEHFYCDGIGKVCNRENQNSFLVSYFPRFHFHNLAADNDLAHLLDNTLKRNGLAFEIPSIYNIRVGVLAVTAAEISPFALLFEWLFLEGFLLLCSLLLFLRLCCWGFFCLFALFFLFCSFCFCRFISLGKLGILQHICHFLLDLDCRISAVFALLSFHIIQGNLQVHTAALAENLVQILDEDLAFLSGDDGIRQYHVQTILLREGNLCLLEQVVFQHVVIAKLQFHAGTIGVQKVLRRVLSGQMELLDYLHTHFKTWKALSLNLLFQAENMLFVDPAVASQIDAHTSFGCVARYLGDDYLFQKLT